MGGLKMTRKTLNIGMVGYGFMGRTHSNAFAQAPHFFDLAARSNALQFGIGAHRADKLRRTAKLVLRAG